VTGGGAGVAERARAKGIDIRRLGPDTVDDLLAFFEGAFADNPWWSGCYCAFYHTPGQEWDSGPEAKERNREFKRQHILAGRSQGYLAYVDGMEKPVGWLNAAPRESYENPRGLAKARDGTPGVGALMCFVVAPGYRGRGVAAALLEAACEGFRRDGLRYAEGYARVGEKREDWETFETMNYHGPLPMYEKAGFTKVGEIAGYAVMRKSL
jgi:ribosomal protein S18 acetylase RimI-like enzyme